MNDAAREPILRIAVPTPVATLFDYLPPTSGPSPDPGARVVVPFGQRRLVGVVMSQVRASTLPREKLARVARCLDEGRAVFDAELLNLLEWCWRYYKHPAGEVVFNALPPALRATDGRLPDPPIQYRLTDSGRDRLEKGPGRAPAQWGLLEALRNGATDAKALRGHHTGWRALMRKVRDQGWLEEVPAPAVALQPVSGPELHAEQSAAYEAIRADLGRFRCHLLHGVAGSGKTEVYLRLIQEVIAAGRQVLVLVPEIGLTPQLVDRMQRRLGLAPLLSHSGLSRGERLDAWAAAAEGRAPLLVGTRSALFLPMPRAGLLIMDESHDPSFKQQDGFRFAARDVAVKRASRLGVPIVLGTATPALETLHNAATGRYAWHRLKQRATGAQRPDTQVLDLRQQETTGGLAEAALSGIGETLERGEQVLVFLNRRGYAPVVLCHDCGWHANCHRCDAHMTWHRSNHALVCHHCGHRARLPRFCPECRADALQGAGEGTEQLESLLAHRFEGHELLRFDRDQTHRKGAFDEMVGRVRDGGPAILVGTQMLAKGHHFPLVTLVVILGLDQALYSSDFRALERMGQLMTQVAGRAGRAQHPGRVMLQTHHPDHPLLERLIRSGYEAFAMELLEERKLASLPPFSAQATLRAEAPSQEQLADFLGRAKRSFPARGGSTVHGPFPALMERRGGRFRWYLMAQDSSRKNLQASLDRWLAVVRTLPEGRRVRWAIDVDPQEF